MKLLLKVKRKTGNSSRLTQRRMAYLQDYTLLAHVYDAPGFFAPSLAPYSLSLSRQRFVPSEDRESRSRSIRLFESLRARADRCCLPLPKSVPPSPSFGQVGAILRYAPWFAWF